MEPKSEKPLRLFVNPFATWTDLALKTGQAMLATAQAAAARSNVAVNVAVIPTAGAPAPTARAEARRDAEVAVLPAADAPRKARAPARQSSKAARFKATRGKLRNKTNAKRRTRR